MWVCVLIAMSWESSGDDDSKVSPWYSGSAKHHQKRPNQNPGVVSSEEPNPYKQPLLKQLQTKNPGTRTTLSTEEGTIFPPTSQLGCTASTKAHSHKTFPLSKFAVDDPPSRVISLSQSPITHSLASPSDSSLHVQPAYERAISPWRQSLSPEWPIQHLTLSLPSTQTRSLQYSLYLDTDSPPALPTNIDTQQVELGKDALPIIETSHATLPSIDSLHLDSERRGTLSFRGIQEYSYSLSHPHHAQFAHFPSSAMNTSPKHSLSIQKIVDSHQVSSIQSLIPLSSELKLPLPQNIRGDPFRSAKVKTELCRYYNSPSGCIFGDKCNYAHGEEELKLNKLMDLEAAGLIDVEVFRTHPCFTWVATGACPFDQRCTRMHDPRVNGLQPSWLPHAEVLINNAGRGIHVDKMYHELFSSIYSCTPVYGFAPKKRWQAGEENAMAAWNEFRSFCCNMEESQPYYARGRHWPLYAEQFKSTATSPPKNYSYTIPEVSEIHLLEMVLKMRQRKKAQFYTYLPTHLFCGELCMVLQTCFFRLEMREDFHELTEKSEVDGTMFSENERFFSIVAREIAFGAVADASVRPVAVWFNIPEEDIVPCTRQQARRHKRSRHRLREKRSYESNPEEVKISTSCTIPPFNCHQPVDESAFNLITLIQYHRYKVLKCFTSTLSEEVIRSIKSEEIILMNSFESQRRFWTTWTWPKRIGSNDIDDNTDVPDVHTAYNFVTYGDQGYGEDEIFFGADQGKTIKKQQIISSQASLATGFIWKSFVFNLQLLSDRGAVQVPPEKEFMPTHDPIISRLTRIRTLRNLSLHTSAISHNDTSTIPRLTSKNTASPRTNTSLDAVIREWTALQHQYEENSSNPLKESQIDKISNPNQQIPLSYSFDVAAQKWTRSLSECNEALTPLH